MRKAILSFFIVLLIIAICNCDEEPIAFPENFLFGTSSSAFQVEGAWNESGKGESIWDHFGHYRPEKIIDRSNADIASDTFHLYEKDIEIYKFIHSNAHRLSLSWPRILPQGNTSEINYSAITFYRNVIIALKKADILPIVTLYHWDLPQILQETLGGWENPDLANYFEDYARVVFENFHDLVSNWVSFNEPDKFCLGYAFDKLAPGLDHYADGIYKCAHTVVLSHSKAYHLYKENFCNKTEECNFGIVLNIEWAEPKNSSEENQNASNDYLDFHFNLYAKPIFSKEGDFPEVIKTRAGDRLPKLTNKEKEQLIGTADFLGMNHYTTYLVSSGVSGPDPSFERDQQLITEVSKGWSNTNSDAFFFVPWGMRKSIIYIHQTYPDVKLLITENGYAGNDEMHDSERIRYLISYMREALKVTHELDINLYGYLHWTALDNFELMNGYHLRFGLCSVNFSDPNRPRTTRDSAHIYAMIGETKIVPPLSSIRLDQTYERKTF